MSDCIIPPQRVEIQTEYLDKTFGFDQIAMSYYCNGAGYSRGFTIERYPCTIYLLCILAVYNASRYVFTPKEGDFASVRITSKDDTTKGYSAGTTVSGYLIGGAATFGVSNGVITVSQSYTGQATATVFGIKYD